MPPYRLTRDSSVVVDLATGEHCVVNDRTSRATRAYLRWVAAGNEPQAAPPPRQRPLLKTEIIAVLSDVELDNCIAALAGLSLRKQQMWAHAVEIARDDPDVLALLTAVVGAQRAAEIME